MAYLILILRHIDHIISHINRLLLRISLHSTLVTSIKGISLISLGVAVLKVLADALDGLGGGQVGCFARLWEAVLVKSVEVLVLSCRMSLCLYRPSWILILILTYLSLLTITIMLRLALQLPHISSIGVVIWELIIAMVGQQTWWHVWVVWQKLMVARAHIWQVVLLIWFKEFGACHCHCWGDWVRQIISVIRIRLDKALVLITLVLSLVLELNGAHVFVLVLILNVALFSWVYVWWWTGWSLIVRRVLGL